MKQRPITIKMGITCGMLILMTAGVGVAAYAESDLGDAAPPAHSLGSGEKQHAAQPLAQSAPVSMWDKISQSTRQLPHTLQQYSAQERDVALEKAQAGLTEISKKVQTLGVKLNANWKKMQGAVRDKYATQMQQLQNEEMATKNWLESLKNSTQTDWENVKASFISAFDGLCHHWVKLTQGLHHNNTASVS